MWEHHAIGIARDPGLPADRRGESCGIDAEQHQVGPAGVQPVGRQMDLFRTRQVHEAHGLQRVGPVHAGLLGGLPIADRAQVNEHVGGRI